MYEMKDEFYTGIQMIDEEHTKLIQICEDTYQLLNDELLHDKYDHLYQLIEELKAYTKKHFADEEEYMKSINYKRIYLQKVQHRKFIAKLDSINLLEADEKQHETITELLAFLTDWLFNHIIHMDKLIGT